MKTAGTAQPLIDGIEKVTGRARYTADLPSSHALVGEVLRSPIAHGEIVRVDTTRARALKLGLKKSGEICAADAEVVQRGGAYAGYGIVTILYAGALAQALYRLPAVRYRGFRVYANTPPCGPMRGHGSVDMRHAFETLLDTMAEELGLDPFAVRRANLLEAPHRTLNELQVNSYGLPACLDWVEQASGWKERRKALPRGRGLGMACSHYASGAAKPVRIALTGTNPRPLLVSGTEELVGKQIDESLLARLSKLVQKQAGPVRTTLAQANYRRQVAAVTAQRLVKELAAL
ncbi:MAG: hypothetical protein A3G81_28395 [Betaproteobacteria bacterium RIFCSPLOWO2_12_FULL_65_14]|nr:MAG: hypothetical protein A3G81_28395 [Betaproteobacteria bacterium RIFCSPLOWO2_12_FULL_65_14]